MLANAEDEGVVESNVGTLRLSHIEIVPLSVWSGMQRQERVGRVVAGMCHGETDGKVVGVHLVRVLQQLVIFLNRRVAGLTIRPFGPAYIFNTP